MIRRGPDASSSGYDVLRVLVNRALYVRIPHDSLSDCQLLGSVCSTELVLVESYELSD